MSWRCVVIFFDTRFVDILLVQCSQELFFDVRCKTLLVEK